MVIKNGPWTRQCQPHKCTVWAHGAPGDRGSLSSFHPIYSRPAALAWVSWKSPPDSHRGQREQSHFLSTNAANSLTPSPTANSPFGRRGLDASRPSDQPQICRGMEPQAVSTARQWHGAARRAHTVPVVHTSEPELHLRLSHGP